MPIVGPAPAAGAAPDWPLLDYAICWSAGPSQTPVQNYWCNLSSRTEGTTTVKRGKQYELDQVQPGEMTLTFRNDDGVFDPTNTTSPFWPQVKPYRLIRLRAQYPPTVNLLTATQAVGPFTGNQSVSGFSVTPGANFAAQCQGQGSGVTGTLALQWYSVTGTLISTTTGTGVALPATGWAPVTVTGVAPANAVGAVLTFTQSGGTATTESYQVEQNTTPSTYATPGTWYSLFTGYVERWPQSWSSGGNYGTIKVDCVDLFAFLANKPLTWATYLDILSLSPNWFYPLAEPAGSTAFQDVTNSEAPATLIGAQASAGATLTSSGGYDPLGIPGPVVNVGTYPGTPAPQVSLPAGGPPRSAAFTRVIAFRAGTVLPFEGTVIWLASPQNNYNSAILNGPAYYLGITTTGSLAYEVIAAGGTGVVGTASAGAVSDGGWHLIAITMSSDGRTNKLYLDGSLIYSGTSATDMRFSSAGGMDQIVYTDPNLTPQVGILAELSLECSATQISNLYQGFRYAWETNSTRTETSGSRYTRVLGWCLSAATSVSAVDTGSEVDYGPATDITGGSNPTYALQALQNVVATEYGQHFIAADGTIVFQARTARYNPAPAVSFGEHAGEVPYTSAAMDNDPTRVANQIEVDTQYGNSPYFASDTASQDDYGQIGLQWTANSLSPESLQDGAEYLLYQNKQPFQRLEALPVDVGANPSLWASLLPLDLGAAVTVNRRPSNAPAMSEVGFLEQITWSIDDQRKVAWSAQVSNAAAHYFGKLDDATYGLFDSTLIFGF